MATVGKGVKVALAMVLVGGSCRQRSEGFLELERIRPLQLHKSHQTPLKWGQQQVSYSLKSLT